MGCVPVLSVAVLWHHIHLWKISILLSSCTSTCCIQHDQWSWIGCILADGILLRTWSYCQLKIWNLENVFPDGSALANFCTVSSLIFPIRKYMNFCMVEFLLTKRMIFRLHLLIQRSRTRQADQMKSECLLYQALPNKNHAHGTFEQITFYFYNTIVYTITYISTLIVFDFIDI